jgi:squalene cyclase
VKETTRRLLPTLVLTGAALIGAWPLLATSEEVSGSSTSLATPASRQATVKALEWLERHQRPDGAWHCDVGFKLNESYHVEQRNMPHVGVSALCGTAFLASGSVPNRGKYSRNVERVLEFLLDAQDPHSGFISAHGTRMYSHAFATLFLAEVFGMTRDERVRRALQRAVEFTYQAQNKQGGWRYVPNAEDSDMSITVCQVVALRAAKNKGIKVPKESIDSAVDYVLRSAVTRDEGGQMERGSFKYQFHSKNRTAQENTRTSFALTSAGLTTLYGAGIYTDDDIARFVRERGIPEYVGGRYPLPSFAAMRRYVLSHYSEVASAKHRSHYFYFYGNYYAAQAMYIAGGNDWNSYFTRLRDDLVKRQLDDGSWRCNVEYEDERGREYPLSTAIGAMLLQIPNNYLPIFQR